MYYGETEELINGGELQEMIDKLMQQQDHNRDGFLTEHEYMVYDKRKVSNKQELWAARAWFSFVAGLLHLWIQRRVLVFAMLICKLS